MVEKLPNELLLNDYSPYELHKYLEDPRNDLGIVYSPQRVYRDLKDGRLSATKDKDGHWRVRKDEATRYLLMIINGRRGSKRVGW